MRRLSLVRGSEHSNWRSASNSLIRQPKKHSACSIRNECCCSPACRTLARTFARMHRTFLRSLSIHPEQLASSRKLDIRLATSTPFGSPNRSVISSAGVSAFSKAYAPGAGEKFSPPHGTFLQQKLFQSSEPILFKTSRLVIGNKEVPII